MSPKVPVFSERVYSDAVLRSESASVLASAFAGIRKLVAATLHVSISRIDRECEGLDANMLELLARALDRVTKEEGADRAVAVVAWLAERYGHDLAPRLQVSGTIGVGSALSQVTRAFGEAASNLIDRAQDGIQPEEVPEIEGDFQRVIELAHRVRREAQAAAGTKSTNVRAMRT